MGRKLLKYIIIVLLCIFIAYNSVYFKKLSTIKAAGVEFNAALYAQNYLNGVLLPSVKNIPATDTLLKIINTNPSSAFDKNAHALDIGNVKYFMAKGSGTVTAISESDVYLTTPGNQNVMIATEYVFGNALRDASGTIKINDFSNTTDLNAIAAELDKIVRNKVLPPFKSAIKKGDHVEYAGAFELNQQHLNADSIEIIPFYLKNKH